MIVLSDIQHENISRPEFKQIFMSSNELIAMTSMCLQETTDSH